MCYIVSPQVFKNRDNDWLYGIHEIFSGNVTLIECLNIFVDSVSRR